MVPGDGNVRMLGGSYAVDGLSPAFEFDCIPAVGITCEVAAESARVGDDSTWMIDDPTWMMDDPTWMMDEDNWMIDDPAWMIDEVKLDDR